MREFKYFEPNTLNDALELLNKYKNKERTKILAGGTDLFVQMKNGKINPDYLINIKYINGLNYIKFEDNKLKIGPTTTIAEIAENNLVGKKFNILVQAALVLGSVQVRNLATIGGNICNAAPSAELAPALLALDAQVKIAGKEGERILPLKEFFVGPGKTILEEEILLEIIVPFFSDKLRGVYLKNSQRKAMDIALVGVAVTAELNKNNNVFNKLNIGLGAVAPTPIMTPKAMEFLVKKDISSRVIKETAKLAASESIPIDDVRCTEWYRKEIVEVSVERAINLILEQ